MREEREVYTRVMREEGEVYPGVYATLPWEVYPTLLYMPTYTPRVYHHPTLHAGAGRYVYTACSVSRVNPWGSRKEKGMGGGLSSSQVTQECYCS